MPDPKFKIDEKKLLERGEIGGQETTEFITRVKVINALLNQDSHTMDEEKEGESDLEATNLGY